MSATTRNAARTGPVFVRRQHARLTNAGPQRTLEWENGACRRSDLKGLALLACRGLSMAAAGAGAHADDDGLSCEKAKAYIAKVTAPVTEWDGPTTGPKAQGKKLIVYVSTDQRNGGAQGAGDGAAEAAKVLGWDVRILDGQGSVPGARPR